MTLIADWLASSDDAALMLIGLALLAVLGLIVIFILGCIYFRAPKPDALEREFADLACSNIRSATWN